MATATLPGIVEMFVRPGQGIAEASEIPETPTPQGEADTEASDLSISPVAELKTNQAFLDAGYPERIQMLHQAIAQERKMPRVKRRFADLAPEKQRAFTTGLLELGLVEPSVAPEESPSPAAETFPVPQEQGKAPVEELIASDTQDAPQQVPPVPAGLVPPLSAISAEKIQTAIPPAPKIS